MARRLKGQGAAAEQPRSNVFYQYPSDTILPVAGAAPRARRMMQALIGLSQDPLSKVLPTTPNVASVDESLTWIASRYILEKANYDQDDLPAARAAAENLRKNLDNIKTALSNFSIRTAISRELDEQNKGNTEYWDIRNQNIIKWRNDFLGCLDLIDDASYKVTFFSSEPGRRKKHHITNAVFSLAALWLAVSGTPFKKNYQREPEGSQRFVSPGARFILHMIMALDPEQKDAEEAVQGAIKRIDLKLLRSLPVDQ